MASCSKDASNSDFGQNAIEFGTYLGRDAQTKGTITDIDFLKGEDKGFGVTAFYTGQDAWTKEGRTAIAPNFMYNQQVTSTDGTNWSYSPVKYWPTMTGDMISFFAYAPYNATGITLAAKDAASNNTSLTFTVADNVADMVDFVAANAIDQEQKKPEKGGQTAVTFNFKHELSRLAFNVKSSLELKAETHIVVKAANLVAAGFTKTATYTFNNNTGENGSWRSLTGTFNATDLSGLTTKKTVELGKVDGKKYSESALADITTEKTVNLFDATKYLFLIPAENGSGLKDKAAAVTFTYDIVTEDANLANGYSVTPAEKTVYLPAGILAQGKAYTVTFTFNMDEIEVSASVANWDEITPGSDIEVPFTPDNATTQK